MEDVKYLYLYLYLCVLAFQIKQIMQKIKMFQQFNVTLDLFLASQRNRANFSSKKGESKGLFTYLTPWHFQLNLFLGRLTKTLKTSIKGCRPRSFGKRPTYSVFTLVIKTITQSNHSNCYCCTPRPAIKVTSCQDESAKANKRLQNNRGKWSETEQTDLHIFGFDLCAAFRLALARVEKQNNVASSVDSCDTSSHLFAPPSYLDVASPCRLIFTSVGRDPQSPQRWTEVHVLRLVNRTRPWRPHGTFLPQRLNGLHKLKVSNLDAGSLLVALLCLFFLQGFCVHRTSKVECM